MGSQAGSKGREPFNRWQQIAETLSGLLHRKPRSHPALLALGIMRYVGVTHGRQFTGGVSAGVSMHARTVGDDLSIFVGQQLRGEFLDTFRWNVQGSGDVRFTVTFRG